MKLTVATLLLTCLVPNSLAVPTAGSKAPSTCSSGLRWAQYNLADGTELDVETILRCQAPDKTGITNQNALPRTAPTVDPAVHRQTVEGTANYNVVQHIGYFHPAKDGDYTFTVPDTVDEAAYVWIGDHAVSGFSADNANLHPRDLVARSSLTLNAHAGQFVPIRILFVNAQLHASFDFTITGPDDKIVASSSQAVTNGQLVPSCGADAPPFDFSDPLQKAKCNTPNATS